MIIRPLKAIVSGKKVVLIEIEEDEKKRPHEIVSFFAEKSIDFLNKNAISNPNNYAFSRKKSEIYQPVVSDNKVVELLILRKEQGIYRWKEIILPESVLFTNCYLVGSKS